MRPIDADALIDELSLVYDIAESKDDPYNIGVMAAIVTVKRMPPIDAVPVVRCKDCKHRPIDTGGHNYGQDLFFPDEDNVCPCQCGDQWYSWMPGDDWFCANGERREDGET